MGGIFLIQTDGKLVEMKEYGLQFKATALKTVPPSSRLYFKPKIILTWLLHKTLHKNEPAYPDKSNGCRLPHV